MDKKEISSKLPTKMEVDHQAEVAAKNKTDSPKQPDMSKLRIMKNLIVVCLGFLFLFSAYQGLANLQSTLNIEGDIGIVSQSVIYAALIISSLFLPKLIIKKIGCKMTLVLSILTYAPYIAVNFYPHMGTFVPTAILLGLGAAPLWSAKCTYLNEISGLYAGFGGDTVDVVTSRFFGIFFMVFQNTQIWGNLISFFVLKPTRAAIPSEDEDYFNRTFLFSDTVNQSLPCGADFCNGINENLKPPSDERRYMLIGIFFSCVILASIIVAIFLDPLKKHNKIDDDDESVFSKAAATLKHLKKPDQLLLVPLTIFSGIEQAFILGDFTKAYVACAWGLSNIGLVFICFGVVNAILSFLAGRLVKYVSRMGLMLTGAVGNLGTCVALFLWQPTSDQAVYFFVIVGVWGLSDAVWQTQVNALYGVLFRSEAEAGFANYRLWESVGFSLAFGYSSFLCIAAKIYILLAFLVVGMAGYIVVEMRTCYRKKSHEISS